MKEQIYDVNYFIAKFKAIPSEKIGYCQLTGCAYGQCQSVDGYSDGAETKEGIALNKLMSSLPNLKVSRTAEFEPYQGTPARINNGDVVQYQQSTPKERILAALYDVKALQDKENKPAMEIVTKEIIRYVAVDSVIRTSTMETLVATN
jgi:hypothetical protein